MDENQYIGFDGVSRNDVGIWLSSFTKFEGKDLVLLVELFSIMYALLLAWERGHPNIVYDSNSLMAVIPVNQSTTYWSHKYMFSLMLKNFSVDTDMSKRVAFSGKRIELQTI
ncbi:unnamed protein product [Lupinus luteus]|uniref:RNase H type-1 domain-containing protein n=1 Tax=Lupinus luteus TaxID=3873 RepID=A0AAV1W9T2_LUPLU